MVRNKVKALVDGHNETRYRFMVKTGLAQATAYSLYENPNKYPHKEALTAICNAYGVTVSDVLEVVEVEG